MGVCSSALWVDVPGSVEVAGEACMRVVVAPPVPMLTGESGLASRRRACTAPAESLKQSKVIKSFVAVLAGSDMVRGE